MMDDVLELHQKLSELVLSRDDAVIQQKAIELLAAQHCARMRNLAEAKIVADALHKHVLQLLDMVFSK